MKKIVMSILMVLGLTACSKQTGIVGNEYMLLNAPNNAEITLAFSDTDDLYFGRVVNRYFGRYKINNDQLTFGPAGSTMMMGPEPLMEAEQYYFEQLPKTVSYQATQETLILTLSDGNTLSFKKIGKVDTADKK